MPRPKKMKGTKLPGKGSKTKTWCKGTIWFDDLGCLHIEDKDLAQEVLRHYLDTGRLCVSFPDDFSPGRDTNIQCAC